MVIVQARSKRKPSGGRNTSAFTKRKSRKGEKPTLTKMGEKKIRVVRERGGSTKLRTAQTEFINAFDSKNKKYIKLKIEKVLSNPANRHYARRNIITKGTLVKTDKGDVKITNRPGQEPTLNGVLVN